MNITFINIEAMQSRVTILAGCNASHVHSTTCDPYNYTTDNLAQTRGVIT